MKVLFLGTGTSQGVPVPGCNCKVCQSEDHRDKRLRSSILLTWNNHNVLIDTSPDLRLQLLKYKIHSIHAVIYTHSHRDHTGGLDDLRPLFFKHKEPIPVFATPESWKSLEKQFYFIFQNSGYPGVLKLKRYFIFYEQPFYLFGKKLIPIKLWHHKMPVIGFRIDNFAYLTDLKKIDERWLHLLSNLDLLVLGVLQIKPHISHLNLEEAISLIERLKPKKVLFTHISHYFGKHKEISSMLPPNIEPAFDGLEILI